jgi:epoxyqueuosine reductase
MISLNALKDVAQSAGIPVLGAMPAIQMTLAHESLKKRMITGELSGFEPNLQDVGNPEIVVPGVKSIIAIGLPYALNSVQIEASSQICEVSVMSWGYDYHDKVREKLAFIADWLEVQGDYTTKYFCDTGPLNDRYIGYLSGIGTYGRHQMLIHPEYGGAIVLGYLLTTAEIEGLVTPNLDPVSLCGTCRLCQIACPTGALKGEFDFHVHRCISNLTQQKRPLNAEESHWVGVSLYGCDLCQKVCPRNPSQKTTQHLWAEGPNRLDPFHLFELDKKTFKSLYGHHGFAWRGLKTLQRNALLNVLNSGRTDLKDQLMEIVVNGTLPDHLKKYMSENDL